MGVLDWLFRPPAIVDLKTQRNLSGLSRALSHKNWETRRDAAAALGEVGGAQGVPALLSALRDATPDVRRVAAIALGAVGDQQVIGALRDLIGDEERVANEWAAEALQSALGAGPGTVSKFVEGVHKERGVRQAAMDAITSIERRIGAV
jgi:HEAT repeat protein